MSERKGSRSKSEEVNTSGSFFLFLTRAMLSIIMSGRILYDKELSHEQFTPTGQGTLYG